MEDDNYMEEDQRGKEGDEGLFADDVTNGFISIAILGGGPGPPRLNVHAVNPNRNRSFACYPSLCLVST